MMTRLRQVVGLVALFAIWACSDQTSNPPTQPPARPKQDVTDRAALEAQINSLINGLYAARAQGPVFSAFAKVKAQLASGRTADAQAGVVSFFAMVLADFKGGQLQDPNGAQPPSTSEALQSLLNSVAQFGGLPAPIPSPGTLGSDGAVQVVGSTGATVVAPSGFGGVRFPAGALPADVIVVISRLPSPTTPKTGPLPTTLDQYPVFYDFSTFPTVTHFAQPVTVGICRLEVGDPFGPASETVADRLRLAHPNPANPSTVEILPPVDVDFIMCDGVALSSAAPARDGFAGRALAMLSSVGSRVAGFFLPTTAYAVHGGLGGLTSSFSPFGAVDPGGVTPAFGQLAVGNFHGCAIIASGQTWCWGDRSFGQLGNGIVVGNLGNTAPFNPSPQSPVPVSGSPIYSQIFSHGSHTCGLLAGGIGQCWGRNTDGEMGLGTTTISRSTPVTLTGGPFVQIAPGRLTTCTLDLSHVTRCWGLNQSGEVGDGSGAPSTTPQLVATPVTFRQIEASWQHTCGLQTGVHPIADTYCWGKGLIVNGTTGNTLPVLINGPKFTRIFAGGTATCGVTDIQVAYCWGLNGAGALGDGTTTDRGVPTLVAGNLSFIMMATGTRPNTPLVHSCGITVDGTAYCWGANDRGQIGDGTTTNRLVPTPVATADKFVAIGTGDVFSCAMRADRKVFCWGDNAAGQLGSGIAGGFSATPVEVPSPF
jgi:alpha-tubulin suppressor-like RCC1 family protein